jgi:phosphoglycolate phosphatase
MPEQVSKLPRLAVFDMDGTLVDSQHMIVAAMGRAFEAEGMAAPPAGSVRRVVGLSLGAAMARLAPDLDSTGHGALEGHYKEAFSALRESGDVAEIIYHGAIDALDALADAGWLLGIATGKSMRGLTSTLEQFGLSDRFMTLQTADIAPSKPAPDMLHRAMADAGVEVGATVMIGDTSFDMEMARNARVAAIGVAWGYHEERELVAAGAARVIASFDELPQALDAILRQSGAGMGAS